MSLLDTSTPHTSDLCEHARETLDRVKALSTWTYVHIDQPLVVHCSVCSQVWRVYDGVGDDLKAWRKFLATYLLVVFILSTLGFACTCYVSYRSGSGVSAVIMTSVSLCMYVWCALNVVKDTTRSYK